MRKLLPHPGEETAEQVGRKGLFETPQGVRQTINWMWHERGLALRFSVCPLSYLPSALADAPFYSHLKMLILMLVIIMLFISPLIYQWEVSLE